MFVSIPNTKNIRTGKKADFTITFYPAQLYRLMWLWCAGEKNIENLEFYVIIKITTRL